MKEHLKSQIKKIIECLKYLFKTNNQITNSDFQDIIDNNYNDYLNVIKAGFMPDIITPHTTKGNNKHSHTGWIFIKPNHKDYLTNQVRFDNEKYKKLIRIKMEIIKYFIKLRNSVDPEQQAILFTARDNSRRTSYDVNEKLNVFDDSLCKEEVVPDGEEESDDNNTLYPDSDESTKVSIIQESDYESIDTTKADRDDNSYVENITTKRRQATLDK